MRTRLLLAGIVVALIAGVAVIARSSRRSTMSAMDPQTQPLTSTNPLGPAPPQLHPPLPSVAEVAEPAPVAVTPRAVITAVPHSPLEEKSPNRNLNDGHSNALHDAIVAATPSSARLYVAFARAGVATPPEAKTLVQMKQVGAPPDELVAYVKTSFPHDLLVRAVALRWLGVGVGVGTHLVPTETTMPTGAQPMRRERDWNDRNMPE